MSTKSLAKIQENLLDTLGIQELEAFILELAAKIYQKKISTKNSKKKITWDNCDAPFREPTLEEAKAIAEFEANPELMGVEETAKFLDELNNLVKNKDKKYV